jgi:hypothetical protein
MGACAQAGEDKVSMTCGGYLGHLLGNSDLDDDSASLLAEETDRILNGCPKEPLQGITDISGVLNTSPIRGDGDR